MSESRLAFEYVGFWRRAFALLIDALFTIPFAVYLFKPMRLYGMNHRTVLPMLPWYLVEIAVVVFLVFRFGGTPGKLVFGLRVVDRDGRYLSPGNAVVRLGPSLLCGMLMLIGQQYMFAMLSPDLRASTLREMGRIEATHHAPLEYALNFLVMLIVLVDLLLINRGHLQQTGHDRMARSFVVTRRSLAAAMPAPGA